MIEGEIEERRGFDWKQGGKFQQELDDRFRGVTVHETESKVTRVSGNFS